MDKIKVLIVDDHTLMRDGISALLGIHGDIDIVGEASDGKEALRKTQELAPDVIIMDVAMPGMDGLEATSMIMSQNSKAKILILTQYNSQEHMQAAIQAGAFGFLPKGTLITDLIQAIHVVHDGDFFL